MSSVKKQKQNKAHFLGSSQSNTRNNVGAEGLERLLIKQHNGSQPGRASVTCDA